MQSEKAVMMEASQTYRVMIIEDHEDTRKVLEMLLMGEGFDVLCAATPDEALKLAKDSVPDAILSDISLPDMDGYQLLAALKKLPGLESVPAIALTGFTDQSEQSQAINAGFADYLPKPVDYDVLFKKLASLIKRTDA